MFSAPSAENGKACESRGDRFIPSTIPKIEYETAQELDSAVLNVYGCTQAADIFGDVIAENDTAHRRLARAGFAHKKDFLLLGFLKAVHAGGLSFLLGQRGVA